MKRAVTVIVAAVACLALTSAFVPGVRAGDGGGGGSGTATFSDVPFIAVDASASFPSLRFTDPSLPPPGYGEAPCTGVQEESNAGVYLVTCLAGQGGSLGEAQYVALVSGQGDGEGKRLVSEVTQVMSDVSANNTTAICTDLDTFEKTVFNQESDGSDYNLKYFAASDLIWGAELWENFHNCPTPPTTTSASALTS